MARLTKENLSKAFGIEVDQLENPFHPADDGHELIKVKKNIAAAAKKADARLKENKKKAPPQAEFINFKLRSRTETPSKAVNVAYSAMQ